MSSLVRRLQKKSGQIGVKNPDAPKPNSLPARGRRKGNNKNPPKRRVTVGE